MPRYILLRETASTNSYMNRIARALPSGTVIYTYKQTAGRGQKGNSWESQPGMNLAFSFLLKRPALEPARQFYISEAASLAIVQVLNSYTPGFKIKWPNDVYHDDRKACGMLIESSLVGRAIDYTIIGPGINVNQERFVSDAPNPVSLAQLTGKRYDLDEMLHRVCERIEALCDFSRATSASLAQLHKQYLGNLYRNDGQPHPFALPSGEQFMATISGIDPDGTLHLRHAADGTLHAYQFKQVKHVIGAAQL